MPANCLKARLFLVCFTALLFSVFIAGGQAKITTDPFYKAAGNNMVWVTAAGRKDLLLLADYIAQSPYLGLQEQNYRPQVLNTLLSGSIQIPPVAADSLAIDQQVTVTAIQFFSDMAFGRFRDQPVKFNGPPYTPEKGNSIATRLAASLAAGRFNAFLKETEPPVTAYYLIKEKIAAYYRVVTDPAFKEILVTAARVDTGNRPLLQRLQQLGILDSLDAANVTGSILKEKLREAQRLFNLFDDGAIRSNVTNALNVPLAVRLQALNQSLNQLRWIYAAWHETAIVVNIPSADLVVYRQDSIALYSRVVVGKRSTPTPTLCSRITEVVLFPYWTVPYKIATRELLPHIQQNVDYLEANQFAVLDRKGKVVDARHINWQSLSVANFPYVLRQSTGCDNSMGVIKLDFASPFSVYLHDTPLKSLFMLNQRYFSHGCIRVEEAAAVARILLEERAAAMDTLLEKGAAPEGKPVSFRLPAPAWVFVLYNTAWVNDRGALRFYSNIYDLPPGN